MTTSHVKNATIQGYWLEVFNVTCNVIFAISCAYLYILWLYEITPHSSKKSGPTYLLNNKLFAFYFIQLFLGVKLNWLVSLLWGKASQLLAWRKNFEINKTNIDTFIYSSRCSQHCTSLFEKWQYTITQWSHKTLLPSWAKFLVYLISLKFIYFKLLFSQILIIKVLRKIT